MEKLKILLISDLHLGMERTNPLITGEERLSTFRRIISLAHKHDILLIAGNLIHDENIHGSYYGIIKDEFLSLIDAGIEIYYIPGPGELTSNGKLNSALTEIKTTYTFSDEKNDYAVKSSKGYIFIYGLQCNSIYKQWNISRVESGGFHIGLFHADFNPQVNGPSDTGSIKKDDIKKLNLDFYALGKSHTFKMFRFSNKIIGSYPGSCEPCTIDETGDRFAVSMEIEENVLNNIKRIAVNTVKIHSDVIDCSTVINQNSLFEKIKSTYPEKSIVNIILSGERDFMIETDFKTELSEYFRGLKISDTSSPSLKVMAEESAKSTTLKGVFFQILNKQMKESAAEKIKSEVIADIISKKSITGKSEGAVLCDF